MKIFKVKVRGRVIARIKLGDDRQSKARQRLKALKGKAKIVGDLLSPSGEVWNADRGRL
jgi:hypothetical protein